MNIFIDTNILYADPFFNSNFSELLLKSSIDGTVNIYIPSICLNELFYKLTDKAKAIKQEISNKANELNKWTTLSYKLPEINLCEFENKIQEYYKEKIKNNIFHQLEYKVEFFKKNIDNAIKGTPPFFTDKKEEFRDSIIWASISDFVTLSAESKNYFLTNNYNDYWNHDKTDLHPNLKKECSKIIVLDSVKKLFDVEKDLNDYKKIQEIKKWLQQQGINESSVQDAINLYLWNDISGTIDDEIKKFSIKEIKPDYEFGYILPAISKEQFIVSQIINTTPQENFAIIDLYANLLFPGKLYYPNYEKADFSNYELLDFAADIHLSLGYDTGQLYKLISLEIESIIIR